MSYNWDHLIDGVVVVAYLLCLIVGFYRGKQISGIVRYVLGRCTISTFTLICAFFATHVGAGVVMGTVKRVWNMGALFIITQLFNPIIWFLNAMIYASTVERLRDYLTIICVTKRPMSPISLISHEQCSAYKKVSTTEYFGRIIARCKEVVGRTVFGAIPNLAISLVV